MTISIKKTTLIFTIMFLLCGCQEKVIFDYYDSNDVIDEDYYEEEIIEEDVSKDVLYRIVICDGVKKLNIRSTPTTSNDSNIIGNTNTGLKYDVYSEKRADGYLWREVGENMWIADNGEWCKVIPDNYDEKSEYLSDLSIGSIVDFGKYEQDGRSGSKEDIEWIVLDRKDNKLLLISNYGLEHKKFDSKYSSWNESSLRKWLNESFYNDAFTDEEKFFIVKTKNTTEYNKEKTSEDNVFVLSETETNKYLKNDTYRICPVTKYAISNGVQDHHGKCRWWLRTLNPDSKTALYIETGSGDINYADFSGTDYGVAVRPAIWIQTQ